MKTKAILLTSYPNKLPSSQDVRLVDYTLPKNLANHLLIRTRYLSVDPYMRNRLSPGRTKYIASFSLNQAIISMGIAEVIESKVANFKKGDLVMGMLPWQELSLVQPSQVSHLYPTTLPTSFQLGLLGYPGLTAYVGIMLAQLKQGQTVYVSSAAGAVGSLAGQLAKLKDCYVVGSASTDEKVDCVMNTFNFDAAFNYHKYAHDYNVAFSSHCPNGIDINFENVGGKMLEAAIEHLNQAGIVILCGVISQYHKKHALKGPSNFNQMTTKQARFVPYIVSDYEHLFDEYRQYVSTLYSQGKISYKETIVNGIENAWDAFMGLFNGKNIGKMIVAI